MRSIFIVLVLIAAAAAPSSEQVKSREVRVDKLLAAADSIAAEGNSLADLRFMMMPYFGEAANMYYAAIVDVGFDSIRSAMRSLHEIKERVSVLSDSAFSVGLGRAAEELMVVHLVYRQTTDSIISDWREYLIRQKIARSIRDT